jgi:hypothetical protein
MEEGEMSEAREDLAALEKVSRTQYRKESKWYKMLNFINRFLATLGLRGGRFGDQRR